MKNKFPVCLMLCIIFLFSCVKFRDASQNNNVLGNDTDLDVSDVVSGNVSSDNLPCTQDIIQTEELIVSTEPVPDEPDPTVFASLESLLSAPPVEDAEIAFCYEDLTTGITYSFNGNKVVYSASVMKLPFAMAVLYEAKTKDMGLEDIYTYTGREDHFGTGEIKNMKIGSTFSYIELIEYSLKYSDNIAQGAIKNKYGRELYFDYVRSIGADSFTCDGGWALSAIDGAKVLRSTWEYLEGDFKYSQRIKNIMIESQHQVMLSLGIDDKEIARKYGWDDRAYHDIGIVYDEHPYTLVFLSDMISGDWTVNGYIGKIARTADEIHEQIWENAGRN